MRDVLLKTISVGMQVVVLDTKGNEASGKITKITPKGIHSLLLDLEGHPAPIQIHKSQHSLVDEVTYRTHLQTRAMYKYSELVLRRTQYATRDLTTEQKQELLNHLVAIDEITSHSKDRDNMLHSWGIRHLTLPAIMDVEKEQIRSCIKYRDLPTVE